VCLEISPSTATFNEIDSLDHKTLSKHCESEKSCSVPLDGVAENIGEQIVVQLGGFYTAAREEFLR
jgi:hypothetical protein